ncbi:hypothetical protein J6590_000586 [Homalodisca vitripennis]|nr:hypothetical protein J6590_000586 [Homalodisca vitripennis]
MKCYRGGLGVYNENTIEAIALFVIYFPSPGAVWPWPWHRMDGRKLQAISSSLTCQTGSSQLKSNSSVCYYLALQRVLAHAILNSYANAAGLITNESKYFTKIIDVNGSYEGVLSPPVNTILLDWHKLEQSQLELAPLFRRRHDYDIEPAILPYAILIDGGI